MCAVLAMHPRKVIRPIKCRRRLWCLKRQVEPGCHIVLLAVKEKHCSLVIIMPARKTHLSAEKRGGKFKKVLKELWKLFTQDSRQDGTKYSGYQFRLEEVLEDDKYYYVTYHKTKMVHVEENGVAK